MSGSALALAFHRAGWRVFASARSLAKLKDVTAAGMETLILDTVSDTSITTAVEQVRTFTGDAGLDALVNNARAGYRMSLVDADLTRRGTYSSSTCGPW